MSPEGFTSGELGFAGLVVGFDWLVELVGAVRTADLVLAEHAPATITTAIAPEVRTTLRLLMSAFQVGPSR